MSQRLIVIIVLLTIFLAACSDAELVGDAERGSQLFQESVNNAPACVACHAWTEVAFSRYGTQTGPNLYGVGNRAGTRLAGVSAREYLEQSILEPAVHLAEDYQNNMYQDYADHLSDQDLADLIAYLLTL